MEAYNLNLEYVGLTLLVLVVFPVMVWRGQRALNNDRPADFVFYMVLSLFLLRIGLVRAGVRGGAIAIASDETLAFIQTIGTSWFYFASLALLSASIFWKIVEDIKCDSAAGGKGGDVPG